MSYVVRAESGMLANLQLTKSLSADFGPASTVASSEVGQGV
jgi:hypothetical protein